MNDLTVLKISLLIFCFSLIKASWYDFYYLIEAKFTFVRLAELILRDMLALSFELGVMLETKLRL